MELLWYCVSKLLTHPKPIFPSTICSPSDWAHTNFSSDPPDNVTLSMTPLGAVVKGSSVTFECSCDANPPVKHGDYRLFKDGHLVRSGQSLNVSHIQPSASGRYHCQAWNNLSQRGIQHFNSTIVHLDVQCMYDIYANNAKVRGLESSARKWELLFSNLPFVFLWTHR